MFFGRKERAELSGLKEGIADIREQLSTYGRMLEGVCSALDAGEEQAGQKDESLAKVLSSMENTITSMESAKTSMESVKNSMESAVKSIGVHDVVVEDLSDSLAELRDQEAETVRTLSGELSALRESGEEASRKREDRLLTLLMEYRNQMGHIETLLSEDESWEQQFYTINNLLSQRCAEAGVTLLGQVGEAVNYSLHEVVDVRDTGDARLDRCIAQVYETGYAWQGRIRKARVAAYRLEEGEKASYEHSNRN
jgi:molecular chaperone GrpE (heat shock protein)